MRYTIGSYYHEPSGQSEGQDSSMSRALGRGIHPLRADSSVVHKRDSASVSGRISKKLFYDKGVKFSGRWLSVLDIS